MYFLVEEKFSQSDDFTKALAETLSKHHGIVFEDFDEMTDFLHSFIEKVTETIINLVNQYIKKPTYRPLVHYIPQNLSKTNHWVDITILIDDVAICRIVKAKKEVING